MKTIINLVIKALAVFVAAYIIPGVVVSNFITALAVAVVLGIINTIIKPLIILLTLPINILTLGLFTLIINGLLILLTARIVPGFSVAGLGTAILFSIVLFLVNWFLDLLSK